MFLASKTITLQCATSDHKPIIVHPMGIPIKKRRPWRFEQIWMEDEGCHESIEAAWRADFLDGLMHKVEEKFKLCQKTLSWWSREKFGNITRTLNEKKRLLKAVEKAATRGGGDFQQVVSLKREENILLSQEEKMRHQRGKTHWIQSGDRNTSHFHSRASQRF